MRSSMSDKELWKLAPKEQRQEAKRMRTLNKRMAKSEAKPNRADGKRLASVPSWLDWAVPRGGLVVGDRLVVAGTPARAWKAGWLHVDRWEASRKRKMVTIRIKG